MTQQEFNILSSSIRGKLLAMAGRYKSRTGLDDDAEDIVQEALLTLWKLSSEGYPVRDAEALAVKITKNLAVARLRRRKLDAGDVMAADIEGGTPATVLTDARDDRTIKEILYGGLTLTQRRLMELRNSMGLSLDEISEMTGSPVGVRCCGVRRRRQTSFTGSRPPCMVCGCRSGRGIVLCHQTECQRFERGSLHSRGDSTEPQYYD